ncbi:Phospholipid-transporting ATPase 1 [Hordeum vulgare]|nr:Phospholipid-transporting ATPase 1 [Hordeum vulgare]
MVINEDEKFKAQYAALRGRGGKEAIEDHGEGDKLRPQGKTNSKKEDKRDATPIALHATLEGMMIKKETREEKHPQDKEEQMKAFLEIQKKRFEMEEEKQRKMLEVKATNAKTKAKKVAFACMAKGVEIIKVELSTVSSRKRPWFGKMHAHMLKFNDE